MKITIELDLAHVGTTGREDPERMAEFIYYQHLDGDVMDAGNHGEARYEITGYRLVASESETDAEGNDLDILPETPVRPSEAAMAEVERQERSES